MDKLALMNEYCALTGRPATTWGSVDIMGFYLWMESSRSMKG